MGLFDFFRKNKQENEDKLEQGLEKTKTGLFAKISRAVMGKSTIDDNVLDELEEILITSDVGVETAVRIINRIRERVAKDKYMNAA
ncbi:MAG: signal recognition particle receptor subunit alpha, partial [Bacteroidia bacterium]|nr:signal recognition particle receptor subunit alpha [Bacteroidia bacterium]